jgi:hypothetical protein
MWVSRDRVFLQMRKIHDDSGTLRSATPLMSILKAIATGFIASGLV